MLPFLTDQAKRQAGYKLSVMLSQGTIDGEIALGSKGSLSHWTRLSPTEYTRSDGARLCADGKTRPWTAFAPGSSTALKVSPSLASPRRWRMLHDALQALEVECPLGRTPASAESTSPMDLLHTLFPQVSAV